MATGSGDAGTSRAAATAAETAIDTYRTGRFDQVLDDWIYAERRLLGTLDIKLLERHAETQLARALNSRRLIAVIGSGVSSGYGQPSWSDLLQNMIDAVWSKLDDVAFPKEKLPPEPDTLRPARQPHDAIIAELARGHAGLAPGHAELAQAARALHDGSEDWTADTIPFLFELCENVLVALHRTTLSSDRAYSRAESKLARAAMRARLRWQIRDHRGRLALLLVKLLRSEAFRQTAQAVAVERLCDRLERPITPCAPPTAAEEAFAAAIAAAAYTPEEPSLATDVARKLANSAAALDPATAPLVMEMRRLLSSRSRKGADTRHVLEAGLMLLDPVDAIAALTTLVEQLERSVAAKTPATAPPRGLPRHRDPLAMLLDECNIQRFLTTNYDDEIERLLEGRGFRPMSRDGVPEIADAAEAQRLTPEPSRMLMISPTAERAEVLVHEAGAAAFLYDYGADTRENRPQVLHIHGRARTPSSWLVLSERDYRERYAREDDPSIRADDAMRLIFTANPLLFLGLGMEEPDILRPLRAFSEGTSRLCDRPAVALLPAELPLDDKSRRRVERKQRLTLTRYGVYLLHYGNINLRRLAATANRDDTTPPAGPICYMPQLLQVQGAIARQLGKNPPSRSGEALPPGWDTCKIDDVEGETGPRAAILEIRDLLRTLHAVPELAVLPESTRKALEVLNGGIKGTILTTFLAAWLANMGERWKAWLEDWSAAPRPREPFGSCQPINDDVPEYTRHRILLRNLDSEEGRRPSDPARALRPGEAAPSTDRFFAGAPSPAFQVLRAALLGLPETDGDRRVFYLLGERGTGRGHVFSALRSPRRFAQVCEWLGLIERRASVPDRAPQDRMIPDQAQETAALEEDSNALLRTRNIGRVFFNLGLSHEVISTFDRLIWIFEEFAKQISPGNASEIEAGRQNLRDDRHNRLRQALDILQSHRPMPQRPGMKRVVVVMNHVNVFFDNDGRAKNAQVDRLFNTLVDPRYAAAPIDFLFFMNERHLPQMLRDDVAAGNVRWLRPHKLSIEANARLHQRIDRALGAAAAERLNDASAADGTAHTYLHFLQRMRPITLAVRFFPRAAALLLHMSRHPDQRVVAFDDVAREDMASLGFAGDDIVLFQRDIRKTFEMTLGAFGGEDAERLGGSFAGSRIEDVMLAALDAYLRAAGSSTTERRDRAAAAVRAGVDWMTRAPHPAAESGPDIPSIEDRRLFNELATDVGHNRFAMTIVLAAIEDMIARRIPGMPIGVDCFPIRDFLERLRRNTVGRSPETREDVTVRLVLDLYRNDVFSAVGKPLPVLVPDEAAVRISSHEAMFELQEAILVVLSLVGQPVELRVLTGVETVAAALQRVGDTFDEKSRPGPIRLLAGAVNLLVQRCLVYRVAPRGTENRDLTESHRFATHKAIRRHLFRQFKAPNIDYSQVDQLTMSLYATQPDDLPRPTAEGHRRIRRLIDQLSLFEKATDEPGHQQPDPYLEAARGDKGNKVAVPELHRVRLRAAYGALRSVYSVGVVSRFSAYEDEGFETPENGYFESHRLRVRWMLRLATKLDRQWERSENIAEAGSAGSRTFHAEEIVWLFNECGVLSLAQGRMSDAAALLGQAMRVARDMIERREWGPLHARIGVNRAIADIVRGRMRDADGLLARVVAEGSAEHPALVAIARGYRALIQDLGGDQRTADVVYRAVIADLIKIARYRAAAIFCIQRAECLQRMGDDRLPLALDLAEQATRMAAKGGHEDIRHLALLATIALRIADPALDIAVQRRRAIENELDGIATYARLVGVPRIDCRVALVRGELALRLGDFGGAAGHAEAAMQIATRHDLELHKIAAMALLGIALFRLDLPQARTLLLRARDLAYHVEYLVPLARIEAVLAEQPVGTI